MIESSHADCFQPNKLEKISFNNIVAMKISAVFKCNSTIRSWADSNLDTVRFYQKVAS